MLILNGGFVTQLAYMPDGRTLVQAGGSSVCLWDLQSGKVIGGDQPGPAFGDGHSTFVRPGPLAISPDGQLLALGKPKSGRVGVFNLRERLGVPDEEPKSLSLGPGLQEQRHLLFADTKALLVGSHFGCQGAQLSVWALETGSCQARFPGFGYELALSPDGTLLASGGVDLCVQVWERRRWQGDRTDQWEFWRRLSGPHRLVCGLAFRSGGQSLLAITAGVGDEPCEVLHWDLDTAGAIAVLPGPPGPIMSQAISPDGAVLAWTGADESVIHLWDLQRGRALETLDWGLGQLTALCFAPDGSTAAAAGKDGRIVVWDLDLFDR